MINRTKDVAAFTACDSCLFLVREAVDETGRWREVETPPTTSCGNSFHAVALPPDQYWEFPARLYSGPIRTKLRFRLVRKDGGSSVYSNEFEGEVAAVQFEERGRE